MTTERKRIANVKNSVGATEVSHICGSAGWLCDIRCGSDKFFCKIFLNGSESTSPDPSCSFSYPLFEIKTPSPGFEDGIFLKFRVRQ
jgi:hypothetical protein